MTLNYILCGIAILCTIISIRHLIRQEKPKRFAGGSVRAHVPGSSSRGKAGGSRHESSCGADTALVVASMDDGPSGGGHHGGGDHHGCSSGHSCGGSHGCGGDGGGGGD